MTFETPPAFVAKDTETMVLGVCLEYDGMTAEFIAVGLRDAHFFSPVHRIIWRRLVEAVRGTEDLEKLPER